MKIENFLICLICLFVISCAPLEKYERLRQSSGRVLETHVGGQIFKVKYTKDLVNVVGGADIFGGKVDGGHLELLYLGLSNDKKIMLQKNDVEVQSFETTMNRYGVGGAPSAPSPSVDVIPTRFTFDPRQGNELIISNIKVKFLDVTSNSLKYMLYQTTLGETVTKSTPPVNISQPTLQPPPNKPPQSGTGSGFFVSKMGHIITNAHVVKGCKKLTVGDNANKQVPAEIVNTDVSNDLALLKLSTLEMASADSKSLIQKLSIAVVPIASKGLLRSEDVKLGDKILVAGYPFGDAFSNSIKVTTGVVSSTRGVGDDSGQFQLGAAVQPGNSGGPIYDSSGNIVGVVISQLNKKTFGSLVENVNFGVKASTVRQFLISSGLNSRKSAQTDHKSTEHLAEIAQNQALMVMCLQ